MERPAECLVHLCTTESVKLRALFETLNPILVEGTIEFNAQGMSSKCMNIIILSDMQIRADEVEEYVCNEKTRISVNFATIYDCLSSVGQDEAVAFQITEKSMNAVTPYMSVFIINHTDEEEYVFTFNVVLLALMEEDFNIPVIDFTSVVSIPSASFARVLRCCEKRGNYVQICTLTQAPDSNYIVFITDGDDASVRFHMKFQVDPKTWKPNSCIKMDRYSLKYLTLITKATSLSTFVTLYLKNQFPLAIRYSIGTIGEINFSLAPQIELSDIVPDPIIPLSKIFHGMETIIAADDVIEKNELGEVEAEIIEVNGKRKTVKKNMKQSQIKDSGQKLKRRKRIKKRKDTEQTHNILEQTADDHTQIEVPNTESEIQASERCKKQKLQEENPVFSGTNMKRVKQTTINSALMASHKISNDLVMPPLIQIC